MQRNSTCTLFYLLEKWEEVKVKERTEDSKIKVIE